MPASEPVGHLALFLHAHLPFVRHLECDDVLEERWLFEAITESYLPLLGMLDRLGHDGVPCRLTLSLTPPLLHMLTDELLLARYLRYLDARIAFAELEVRRTAFDSALRAVAALHQEMFRGARREMLEQHGGDLVASFRRHQDEGRLEIAASAATHGYLPLLLDRPGAVEAQVAIGVAEYRRFFDRAPLGFWLPECGFEPGIEAVLARHGIRWFVVEAHGLVRATPRPLCATFAPVITPAGPAAFGRDVESAARVWSSVGGYPGHPAYREFHRDIGFDLDPAYVGPLLGPGGERVPTGFKYHRVTGPTDRKEIYDPAEARRTVESHAREFVEGRARQIVAAAAAIGRAPIVVAPYDAELFGHWWFEGPAWLEETIRRVSAQRVFALATPADHLARYPVAQESLPAASSWGEAGHGSVWLAPENAWIYPRLDAAAGRMSELAVRFAGSSGAESRALDQAARELLLAQSSDWAFILSRGTVVEYAERRVRCHLERFDRIHDDLVRGHLDEDWLREIEARDNLFPRIDRRPWA